MALLFIKSLLFPRGGGGGGGKYIAISPSPASPTGANHRNDLERGQHSIDSSSSSSDDETVVDFASSTSAKAYPEKHSEASRRLSVGTSTIRVNPRTIADATIGLSDGLTVPFALTAGLSALGDTKIVVYGGLAELIAGGISMGLGGYLGAKSEAEAYHAALAETKALVEDDSEKAAYLVRSAFSSYDFADDALDSMTSSLLAQPHQLIDFLMRFHHQLTEADYAPSRAYISGLTISAGYFFGGLIPLLPYFLAHTVDRAFLWSMAVMGIALFAFGWFKTSLLGELSRTVCLKNALQMMLLGGVAAGAAMGCVQAIGT